MIDSKASTNDFLCADFHNVRGKRFGQLNIVK